MNVKLKNIFLKCAISNYLIYVCLIYVIRKIVFISMHTEKAFTYDPKNLK